MKGIEHQMSYIISLQKEKKKLPANSGVIFH